MKVGEHRSKKMKESCGTAIAAFCNVLAQIDDEDFHHLGMTHNDDQTEAKTNPALGASVDRHGSARLVLQVPSPDYRGAMSGVR